MQYEIPWALLVVVWSRDDGSGVVAGPLVHGYNTFDGSGWPTINTNAQYTPMNNKAFIQVRFFTHIEQLYLYMVTFSDLFDWKDWKSPEVLFEKSFVSV